MTSLRQILDELRLEGYFRVELRPLEAHWFQLPEAINGRWLQHQLQHYATCYPGLDQRGQGAFLISQAAYGFATIVAACDLYLQQLPDISPEVIGINTECNYFDLRIVGSSMTPSSPSRMRELMLSLMQVFIEPVRKHSGLNKAPQWRLVTDALLAAFLIVGRRLNCEAQARARALEIITSDTVLYNRQAGYVEVETWSNKSKATPTRHRQTYRVRGGCCRLYTAHNQTFCSTCVHLKNEERQQRLQRAFEQELSG